MTHCRCSAPTLRRELLAESIPDTHHTTFTFSTRSHTDMCHVRHVEHSDDMPSMAPITCIYRITVSIHAVLSQTQTTRQRLQIAVSQQLLQTWSCPQQVAAALPAHPHKRTRFLRSASCPRAPVPMAQARSCRLRSSVTEQQSSAPAVVVRTDAGIVVCFCGTASFSENDPQATIPSLSRSPGRRTRFAQVPSTVRGEERHL